MHAHTHAHTHEGTHAAPNAAGTDHLPGRTASLVKHFRFSSDMLSRQRWVISSASKVTDLLIFKFLHYDCSVSFIKFFYAKALSHSPEDAFTIALRQYANPLLDYLSTNMQANRQISRQVDNKNIVVLFEVCDD